MDHPRISFINYNKSIFLKRGFIKIIISLLEYRKVYCKVMDDSFKLQRSFSVPVDFERRSSPFPLLRSVSNEQRVKMQDIRKNGVVKVFTDSSAFSKSKPWTIHNASFTGSGFIIENHIIVTNAHVIEGGKMVTVRKLSDGTRYMARVLAVANDVDLAFITVDDEEFWGNYVELEISSQLVRFQDEVQVVGYPQGGDTVCVTEGVVSRIDYDAYSQSSKRNLVIQVDAAINGGNSGGPCLFNGKVCGVAFQGLNHAQNVGYIIPAKILIKMLNELSLVSDRKVSVNLRKFGTCPATFQCLENPSLKKYADLPGIYFILFVYVCSPYFTFLHYFPLAGKTGVLVTNVGNFGYLKDVLQVDDIITSVDGNDIGFDGKVAIDEMDGDRIDFRILFSNKLGNFYI